MHRYGPTPLPLHLSLAASICMQHDQEGEEMLRKFLHGVKAYQASSYRSLELDYEVLWQKEQVRIFNCKRDAGHPPVLMVPSLINKSTILDIHPERSMMQYMQACLLDWGESLNDTGQQSLELVVTQRLIPAFEYMLEEAGQPAHAIGYCMGGTLLLAAAQIRPDLFASLTLLATPWDFHAGDRAMQQLVQSLSPGALGVMATQNKLGSVWTQSLFAALEPEKTAQKFINFVQMDAQALNAEIFVAVEDWLNAPVDLPCDIARSCILEWYGENTTANAQWCMGDVVIDPAQIRCPVFVVSGKRDKLVPYQSSEALLKMLQHKDHVCADFGHIGLVASSRAPQQIWAPIKKWICAQDALERYP